MDGHAAYLSAFTSGNDTRQLYALDRRTDAIVFLPEGGKAAVWADCRARHLVCPVPGCDQPTITAVGGSRRHHFRHRTAVTHRGGAESYYHLAAKAALASVLETKHPEAHVQVDYLAVDNGQIPDLLVHFPDDRCYAIEIQYAAMTVEEWERRHDGYRTQGIVDVWLFGHFRPHLRRPRQASFRNEEDLERSVIIGDLLAAVHEAGMPVRFINPDERAIATVLWEQSWPGLVHWGEPYVEVEPLDRAQIVASGLRMPVDDAEEAAAAERRGAEERARAEQERRERDELRRAEEAARRERFKEEQLAKQAREWDELRPRFLKTVGLQEVPQIIRQPGNADGGIYWHREHWKARLFVDRIEGRIGETFTFKQAAGPFWDKQQTSKQRVSRALCSYLFVLRRFSYLEFEADGYFIGGEIKVIADLHHPPTKPPPRQVLPWLDVALVPQPPVAHDLRRADGTQRGFITLRGPVESPRQPGQAVQAMRTANGAWVHVEVASADMALQMVPLLNEITARFPGDAKLSIAWPGSFHDLPQRVFACDELLAALEAAATPAHAVAA